MSRRQEFAAILPAIVARENDGNPVHLSGIYSAVERDYPHLVDAEVEPPPSNAIRWKHELRWEIETLVVNGELRRRKELGRGMYSG